MKEKLFAVFKDTRYGVMHVGNVLSENEASAVKDYIAPYKYSKNTLKKYFAICAVKGKHY